MRQEIMEEEIMLLKGHNTNTNMTTTNTSTNGCYNNERKVGNNNNVNNGGSNNTGSSLSHHHHSHNHYHNHNHHNHNHRVSFLFIIRIFVAAMMVTTLSNTISSSTSQTFLEKYDSSYLLPSYYDTSTNNNNNNTDTNINTTDNNNNNNINTTTGGEARDYAHTADPNFANNNNNDNNMSSTDDDDDDTTTTTTTNNNNNTTTTTNNNNTTLLPFHIVYFNSFANPKRGQFMKHWLNEIIKRNTSTTEKNNNIKLNIKRFQPIHYRRSATINHPKEFISVDQTGLTRSIQQLHPMTTELRLGHLLILQNDTFHISKSNWGLLLETLETKLPKDAQVIRLECNFSNTTTTINNNNNQEVFIPLFGGNNASKVEVESSRAILFPMGGGAAVVCKNGSQCSSKHTKRKKRFNVFDYIMNNIKNNNDESNDIFQIIGGHNSPYKVYCMNLNILQQEEASSTEIVEEIEPDNKSRIHPEVVVVEDAWFLNDYKKVSMSQIIQNQIPIISNIEEEQKLFNNQNKNRNNESSLYFDEYYNNNHTTTTTNTNNNMKTKIDKIIYHSLPKNNHRRLLMDSWLSQQSIEYEHFEAGVGTSKGCHPRIMTPERCMGVSGLLFTLLRILDRIAQDVKLLQTVLVLEDDLYPIDPNLDRLQAAIQTVPNDWDIIRFDCWGLYEFDLEWINPFVAKTTTYKSKNYCYQEPYPCKPRMYGGTYAMLFKQSKISKLRNMWNETPYDDADKIGGRPDIQSYCVNVGLFQHLTIRGEASDISLFEVIPKGFAPNVTQ